MKKLFDSNKYEIISKEMDKIKLKTECPYIVQCVDCFKENIYCFFISEYCEVSNH
jgi:hypothetical protein